MTRPHLVDDHAIVREGLRGVLEQAGHQVVREAAEPAGANDGLRRLEVDIALIDIHLGGRSGLDLLHDLRQRGLPVRCIRLTVPAQQRHVAAADAVEMRRSAREPKAAARPAAAPAHARAAAPVHARAPALQAEPEWEAI